MPSITAATCLLRNLPLIFTQAVFTLSGLPACFKVEVARGLIFVEVIKLQMSRRVLGR